MLYTFRSRATADLIMLEAPGRQLLQIIGKPPEAPGIVTVAQLPAAIAAVEAAVVQDEALRRAQQAQEPSEGGEGDGAAPQEAVRLRQRATPFIEMLRRAQAAEVDVTW